MMRFGADFDALIARCSPGPHNPIALGVSGGSDSLALLKLVSDWALKRDRKLLVLTVDHRLRPEAAGEADYVESVSRQFGHEHVTLAWENARKSQAAARLARHRLLGDKARECGASLLLLGHTLDDVIETLFLRRRRGLRGPEIAGPVMAAPSPVWPEGRDLTVLRPLLLSARTDLQAQLKNNGIEWVHDPSNEDTTYERIAIRKQLQKHPKWQAMLQDRALDALSKRWERDTRLGRMLADLEMVRVDPNGLIHLNEQMPSTMLLAILLRAAGGHDVSPKKHAIEACLSDLKVPGTRRTLAGAWLQKTEAGYLIGRDPGETDRSMKSDLWDGRYVAADKAGFDIENLPFLLRESAPPEGQWQEIISARLAHIAVCYQTPLLRPVQT